MKEQKMNRSDTPLIFDIRRYSVNDGPGIRVTIFFKGCPLRCLWCHNPEGINPCQELVYNAGKCILCGVCAQKCTNGVLEYDGSSLKIERKICKVCGRCTEVCTTGALELAGKYYTIEELTVEVFKERVFFETSMQGGVTICGGEPLFFKDYLIELLKSLKDNGIHTVVDTSLFASEESVREVSLFTDLFLADLKIMDPTLHQKYTGARNETILSNFRLLSELKAGFHVRIPLIEGINDNDKNITDTARFLNSFEWSRQINLLPYHATAVSKGIRIGSDNSFRFKEPSPETLERVVKIFSGFGFNPIIGG